MSIRTVNATATIRPFRITHLGYLYCGRCVASGRGSDDGPCSEDREAWRLSDLPGDPCDGCGVEGADWPSVEVPATAVVEYPLARIF